MTMPNYERLAELIESHRGSCVDLGDSTAAPTVEWVQKAEQRLGKPLPPSYKWFLMNYGGGEISGEEVYSIYGMDFEAVLGGDIVFQYLTHQRARTLGKDEIPLSQTDQGEIYFFRTCDDDVSGEYPVIVKRGSSEEVYAADFASFLDRRIRELCP